MYYFIYLFIFYFLPMYISKLVLSYVYLSNKVTNFYLLYFFTQVSVLIRTEYEYFCYICFKVTSA